MTDEQQQAAQESNAPRDPEPEAPCSCHGCPVDRCPWRESAVVLRALALGGNAEALDLLLDIARFEARRDCTLELGGKFTHLVVDTFAKMGAM